MTTDQPTIREGDWVRLGYNDWPDFSVEGTVRDHVGGLWVGPLVVGDPEACRLYHGYVVRAHKPVLIADRVARAIAEADGNSQPGCVYVRLAEAAAAAMGLS